MIEIEPAAATALEDGFLSGDLEVYVREAGLGPGAPIATVSDSNLQSGFIAFGIEVRTTDAIIPSSIEAVYRHNNLDPTVLFQTLATTQLTDGSDAIDPTQVTNSWLDVVTKDRVLITYRDEWNSPISSGAVVSVHGQSPAQTVPPPSLNNSRVGTVVLPDGWGQYVTNIIAPPPRMLTIIPSEDSASETLTITTVAPAHIAIGSVAPEDWLSTTSPGLAQGSELLDLPLYTNDNHVLVLIDGFATFARLVEDLTALDDTSDPTGPALPGGFQPPDHFVLLGDWWLDARFPLLPSDPDSTLEKLLRKGMLSNHSVIVRAIAWGYQALNNFNSEAVTALDTVGAGVPLGGDLASAFADTIDPIASAASLHWKLSVVRNRHGTFGMLGGVDINPNRLDGPEHRAAGTKYHDVHCRIQGPAVADMTRAFLQRYDRSGLGDPITDSITPTIDTPADVAATHMVQIARTASHGLYPWTPNGDRTILATLQRAIRRARRYIYIEDQYMVAPMIRDELVSALQFPEVEIVLVLTQACDLGLGENKFDECARARSIFLKGLIDHDRVLALEIGAYYVHAKVVIIDDIFAAIGTANINRRSLTADSEIHAFVLDGCVEEGARKFARDLRTQLWAEHMGLPLTPAQTRRLNNIDEAIGRLRGAQTSMSRLIPYHLRNPGDSYPPLWDIVDPDGTAG